MKTVLICNQKGGSGKSTIADNIAWSLERTNTPYNFYDLDGQGGVIHQTNEQPGAKVAVIDTPGALQPDLLKWIEAADCIVIPTKTTMLDVKPLQRMMDLVSKAKCPVIYVLNGWNRFRAAAGFEEWFSETVGKAVVVKVPQSEQIAQAAAYGVSVVDYAPKTPAGQAMLEVCNAVRKAIKLPEE